MAKWLQRIYKVRSWDLMMAHVRFARLTLLNSISICTWNWLLHHNQCCLCLPLTAVFTRLDLINARAEAERRQRQSIADRAGISQCCMLFSFPTEGEFIGWRRVNHNQWSSRTNGRRPFPSSPIIVNNIDLPGEYNTTVKTPAPS